MTCPTSPSKEGDGGIGRKGCPALLPEGTGPRLLTGEGKTLGLRAEDMRLESVDRGLGGGDTQCSWIWEKARPRDCLL